MSHIEDKTTSMATFGSVVSKGDMQTLVILAYLLFLLMFPILVVNLIYFPYALHPSLAKAEFYIFRVAWFNLDFYNSELPTTMCKGQAHL